MPNPRLAISFVFIFFVIIYLSTPLTYGESVDISDPQGVTVLLGREMEACRNHGISSPFSVDILNRETLLLAGILTGEVGFDLNLECREDHGYCGFEGGGGWRGFRQELPQRRLDAGTAGVHV